MWLVLNLVGSLIFVQPDNDNSTSNQSNAASPTQTSVSTSSSSVSTSTVTSTSMHPPTTEAPFAKSSMLITGPRPRIFSERVEEVFFHKSFSIVWHGGSVFLSGSQSGKGSIYVDNEISLSIRSATKKSVHSPVFDLSKNCTPCEEDL